MMLPALLLCTPTFRGDDDDADVIGAASVPLTFWLASFERKVAMRRAAVTRFPRASKR